MITPQQLIESFVQEKHALYSETNARLLPIYSKYFGEPLLQHASSYMLLDKSEKIFEDVNQSTNSATVIMRQRFKSGDLRMRYHLIAADESWKIVGIDQECFMCRGTGEFGDSRCQKCDGEGWHDQRKSSV